MNDHITVVYDICGLLDRYNRCEDKEAFRGTLTPNELKFVEVVEELLSLKLRRGCSFYRALKDITPAFQEVRETNSKL